MQTTKTKQPGRRLMDATAHLLWEHHRFVFRLPPAAKLLATVRQLIHQQAASKCPDAGKHKVVLQQLLVGRRCAASGFHGKHALQDLNGRKAKGRQEFDHWS